MRVLNEADPNDTSCILRHSHSFKFGILLTRLNFRMNYLDFVLPDPPNLFSKIISQIFSDFISRSLTGPRL